MNQPQTQEQPTKPSITPVVPITEKTKALKEQLICLQDVSKEIREIRRLLAADQNKRESRWSAFKRAVNQFFSQT